MPTIKKILVTGGSGFVGTNLIQLLLKKTKHKIVVSTIILQDLEKIILKIEE